MASNREFCLTGNPESMPNPGEFYYYLTNKDNAPLYQSKSVIDNALTDISTLKTDSAGQASAIGIINTEIADIKTPEGQCWVAPTGNDTNTGGISSPFKTVQKALNMLFGVVNVLPGTYTENISIPVGYGQYGPVIQGYGTIEAPKAEIRGTFTIPSGVSRVRIKNLQLDGKGEGSAIVDNGSDGRHVLENVTLANAGVGSAVISVINGKNWWNISGSAIEGAPHLTGTPEAGTTFNIMYSPNSFLCTPIVESGYTFTAYCVGKMGYITHTGGNVYCSNVAAWYPFNGKIINSTSTSPTDVINITYSGFTGDGINYGAISSTGATVSKNNNIESQYGDVCLSAVSTVASTLITTTPSTLIAPTKTFERNISYNATNGELTLLKSSVYNISLAIRVDCTEWNKYAECWIEKWNGTAWVAVDNSGKRQNFQTDQEGGFEYSIVGYYTAGEKYRLRAQSDSDTTVSVKTLTLANGVKQPAIRISIS